LSNEQFKAQGLLQQISLLEQEKPMENQAVITENIELEKKTRNLLA